MELVETERGSAAGMAGPASVSAGPATVGAGPASALGIDRPVAIYTKAALDATLAEVAR